MAELGRARSVEHANLNLATGTVRMSAMDPDTKALADLAQRLSEVEQDVSAHDEVVMRLVREWAASLKKAPDCSALATESKRNLDLLKRPSPEEGLRLRDLYW